MWEFSIQDCFIWQLQNIRWPIKSDKAAGFDGLQAKFLKLSGYKYICCLCDVFNKCVCTNGFPSYMKLAEKSPIHKKDDNLRKENYRSVNLLIMISKVFERILADQLIAYFENLLSSSLSAYRKGYNCQPTCNCTTNRVLASSSWWRTLCRHRSNGFIKGVWSNATWLTHCDASCIWFIYECLSFNCKLLERQVPTCQSHGRM